MYRSTEQKDKERARTGRQRCCNITMDFAMAASQNGVCITQLKCRILILFRSCSMIKDESKNHLMFFGHFMNNIRFL